MKKNNAALLAPKPAPVEAAQTEPRPHGRRPKGLGEIVDATREQLRELTGLKLSSTVQTARCEGGWRICVEMVEKSSIPDSMDVLATYEAQVDEEGRVVEFKRARLRKRMETEVEHGD